MSSFADDFRYVWNGPNKAIYRIIIINVAVWLSVNLVAFIGGFSAARFLRIPSDPIDFLLQPWSIVTHFFTHEGFGHIFWNMIILYWFAPMVANFLGNRKTLAIYMLGGLAGGVAFFLSANITELFASQGGGIGFIGGSALGASAAVYAVLAAAATIAPDNKIHLLLLGPVKLKYLAIAVFILSFFALRGANAGGEFGHLGGLAMGFFFIRNLQQGRDWSRGILSVMDWFEGLASKATNRNKNVKVTYRKNSSSNTGSASKATGKPDPDVVDAILDKISEKGYDSLSAEEKKILFRASQKNESWFLGFIREK